MTDQEWKQAKSKGFTPYLLSRIKRPLIIGLFLVLSKLILPIFNLRPRMGLSDFIFYVIGCLMACLVLGVVTALIGWAWNDSRVDKIRRTDEI